MFPFRITFLVVGLLWAGAVCAHYRDTFETPQPTWALAGSDCRAQIISHRRDFREAHSGHGSEAVTISAGRGSRAELLYALPPARLIPEWTPTLWIKSNRNGLQLMVRVVLPRAVHPETGKPLTQWLYGEIYQGGGHWRQLAVWSADRLLERSLRALRDQYSSQLDSREAYVDALGVNAYGGVGKTELWLDDLEIRGHVAPVETAARRPDFPPSSVRLVAHEDAVVSDAAPVRLRGSLLEVQGRPFFPRMIEHRGESLERLGDLGFNTIVLNAPPTAEQLAEAQQRNLWLVAPPPLDKRTITPAHDRVLAWNLGRRLDDRLLKETQDKASALRLHDLRTKRPFVCGAVDRLISYSRLANVLLLERPVLNGGPGLHEFGRWLQTRPSLARPGTPAWAALPTEPPPRLKAQWRALGQGAMVTQCVELDQLRMLAFHAVASGARGLWFTSHTPLNSHDPDAARRADMLRLINLELKLLEPWTSGGGQVVEVASKNPRIRISSLQTERSQLLLVLRLGGHQQFVADATPPGAFSWVAPKTSSAAHVYHLTASGLRPAEHRRVAGGLKITLKEPQRAAMVLITQDPLAVAHASRTLAETRRETALLQQRLAADLMQRTRLVQQQLESLGRLSNAARSQMRYAAPYLTQSERLLQTNDYASAYWFAGLSMNALARARRVSWKEATEGLASPTANPYCVHYAALPLHWRLKNYLGADDRPPANGAWTRNQLPLGGFEDLQALRRNGWRNYIFAKNPIQARVELSSLRPAGGGSSLRLLAWSQDLTKTSGPSTVASKPPTAIERPPVHIVSPPIPVRRGEIVHVEGWVRAPRAIQSSSDGLLIFDSLGGPELAERITQTKADGSWQLFRMLRGVEQEGDFSLHFVLTGLGEVMLDQFSVTRFAPSAPPPSGYNESPVSRTGRVPNAP